MSSSSQAPYVEIIEQPSPKALRFRYECEGRMAGSLPGATSTADNKTFPAIKVHNYKGEAVVVVSCVTKDKPYRPHPHSLVGKEGCAKGVCTIRFSNESMVCTFPNLGIQCIKKKGIEEALRVRESLRVDPFNTGFSHRSKDIDLNVVRLCFQVFIEGNTPRKFNRPLEAVVSDPIYDKKAMCDLLISDLSHYCGPASGGQKIFLLCEKVVKDDIQIKFFDDDGWEAFAEFQHADVWKQVAIKFKTPPYKYPDRNGVVHIQLVRPSDGAVSEPRPFRYFSAPDEHSMERPPTRKHPRIGLSNDNYLVECIDFNQGQLLLQPAVSMHVGEQMDERVMRHGTRPTARVKKEPVDFMGGGEVEVNQFPTSYQPTMYPLLNQPGPSTSPYPYHSPNPPYAMQQTQFAPSPESKYNPIPSPQYNIAGSPPYPPIDNTYQPSVQFNITPGAQGHPDTPNLDIGSLPSLSDSNLQVLEQFINVDNLSTSFSQNLSFTTDEEKKNNFENAPSTSKDQGNDLDKVSNSNVFRISAKDVPSGFSGLLSDDMSTSEGYLRNDVNMKSYNQLSSNN